MVEFFNYKNIKIMKKNIKSMKEQDDQVKSDILKETMENLTINIEDDQVKIKISPEILINASINTQIEREKQLLTLSSSAIALLVTLLRTVGVSNSLQIGFFAVALFAFLLTVILALEILNKNAKYIDQILMGRGTENKYEFLNRFATITFMIGIIMVVIIGMYSAIISLGEKETKMNKDSIGITHLESVQTNKDTSCTFVYGNSNLK
jgi:hypothetical protein